MENTLDKRIGQFAERCKIAVREIAGQEIAERISLELIQEFRNIKAYFERTHKPLASIIELEEDILRMVTMRFERENPILGREVSDKLWGMLSEDRLNEIDEKQKGERGGADVLEFKKPPLK